MLNSFEILDRIKKHQPFNEVEIGDISFDNKVIERNFDLTGAVFKGTVSFNGTIFKEDAIFKECKFYNKVNFDNAKFEGRGYFAFAKFEDEVSFKETTFEDKAVFGGTIFANKLSLENARFMKETYFGYAKFSDVYFNYARFADRTFFDASSNERIFSPLHLTSFNSVIFEKPTMVIFRSADLQKCSFVNSDLSQVDLTDVVWAYKKGFFTRRKIIYDEIFEEQNKNYELIEKVYRQLKMNYEKRGSYGEAGDFHYGEMEMKRLAQAKFYRYISLTSFYKMLSGYGEKYWLSFLWLFIFLVIFSLFYLITGLVDNNYEIIDYNISANLSIIFQIDFYEDLIKCLVHSFEVATFQKDKIFSTVNIYGRFIEYLEIIIIPVQFTLTILAIKRKYRR